MERRRRLDHWLNARGLNGYGTPLADARGSVFGGGTRFLGGDRLAMGYRSFRRDEFL
jgi:hypothetical protein